MTEPISQYTCANCGGTFQLGWSDDEARAEAVAEFGMDPRDGGMEVVCDDCYKLMKAVMPPDEWHG